MLVWLHRYMINPYHIPDSQSSPFIPSTGQNTTLGWVHSYTEDTVRYNFGHALLSQFHVFSACHKTEIMQNIIVIKIWSSKQDCKQQQFQSSKLNNLIDVLLFKDIQWKLRNRDNLKIKDMYFSSLPYSLHGNGPRKYDHLSMYSG